MCESACQQSTKSVKDMHDLGLILNCNTNVHKYSLLMHGINFESLAKFIF